MKSGLSPDLERVYEQLLWVERRRFRIIESVRSHFGKTEVERALSAQAQAPLLDENQELKFLYYQTIVIM